MTKSPFVYDPSIPLAGVGAGVFCLTALYATYRSFTLHARLMFFFLVGIYIEAAASVSRIISASNYDNKNAYLVAYLAPIVAPSFLAAGCYMIFGRVLYLVTPSFSMKARVLWVSPRWITPIFVSLDLLGFAIQFLGVMSFAVAINEDGDNIDMDKLNRGLNTLKIGLFVQLFCFALFGLLVTRYFMVSRKWLLARSFQAPHETRAVRHLLWAIKGVSLLLMGRAVYRVFEFTQAMDMDPKANRFLSDHEWPFWVMDALPMAIVCLALTIVHPGTALPPLFLKIRLNRRAITSYSAENADWYKL